MDEADDVRRRFGEKVIGSAQLRFGLETRLAVSNFERNKPPSNNCLEQATLCLAFVHLVLSLIPSEIEHFVFARNVFYHEEPTKQSQKYFERKSQHLTNWASQGSESDEN